MTCSPNPSKDGHATRFGPFRVWLVPPSTSSSPTNTQHHALPAPIPYYLASIACRPHKRPTLRHAVVGYALFHVHFPTSPTRSSRDRRCATALVVVNESSWLLFSYLIARPQRRGLRRNEHDPIVGDLLAGGRRR